MKITSIDKLRAYVRSVPDSEQVKMYHTGLVLIEKYGACYIDEETFEVTPF